MFDSLATLLPLIRRDSWCTFSQFPMTDDDYYAEDVALGDLRARSRNFDRFYRRERPKITAPVKWTTSHGHHSPFARVHEYGYVVALAQVPADVADQWVVAHELMHVVLFAEGFPLAKGDASVEPYIVERLNFPHELLVEERLRPYTHPMHNWKVAHADDMASFEWNKAPVNAPAHQGGALIYVDSVLRWELAHGRPAKHGENHVQTQIRSSWPATADTGEELIGMVRRIGYDTPERMMRLLATIAQRLDLAGAVVIAPVPPYLHGR